MSPRDDVCPECGRRLLPVEGEPAPVPVPAPPVKPPSLTQQWEEQQVLRRLARRRWEE